MTHARQPQPQPNPDMNYSALERLDIKFTELIGAIEEKQVDGQLSSKDHGDYELVCYCRGFIRAELIKERRATHTPAAPAEFSRIGKTSDQELEAMAEESYKQITGREPTPARKPFLKWDDDMCPECPCRCPDCETGCFELPFAKWLAVEYPDMEVVQYLNIVQNAASLAADAYALRTPNEREQVLDNILKFISTYESFLKCDDSNFEIYGVKSANLKEHIESPSGGGAP